MTMGTLDSARMIRQTSTPDSSGSIRSSSTRSGRSERNWARASRPSAAWTTRNPSESSASARVSRSVVSSSTTRIVRAIRRQGYGPVLTAHPRPRPAANGHGPASDPTAPPLYFPRSTSPTGDPMRRFLGRLRARVKAYLRPEPYRIRPGQHQVPSEVTPLTDDEQAIVDAFHKLYYDQRVKNRETVLLSWYGHRIAKCPLDIWTYQEIIFDTKPDLIVECGTRFGGGALYLASLLDLRGGPWQVGTIDTTPMRPPPKHPPRD